MSELNETPADSLGAALARARDNRGWLIALGVALVVLGALAVGQSVLMTLASMLLIGALMIAGGLVQIIGAFRGKGWRHMLFWVLSGAFYVLAGLVVIANPVLASGVLTLLIAASLLVAGVARIWIGFKARPEAGWGWLVLGGAVTLLLALVIASGWPVNSLWLIGAFLGVDLMMQGWGLVSLGIALRARD